MATYLLLCFSLLSHPLAIVGLVLAFAQRRRGGAIGMGAASLALGGLALVLGIGGYLYGMHQVDQALMFADSDQIETIRAVGQSEAMISVWCGVASCLVPSVGGLLALARGLTLPREGA